MKLSLVLGSRFRDKEFKELIEPRVSQSKPKMSLWGCSTIVDRNKQSVSKIYSDSHLIIFEQRLWIPGMSSYEEDINERLTNALHILRSWISYEVSTVEIIIQTCKIDTTLCWVGSMLPSVMNFLVRICSIFNTMLFLHFQWTYRSAPGGRKIPIVMGYYRQMWHLPINNWNINMF